MKEYSDEDLTYLAPEDVQVQLVLAVRKIARVLEENLGPQE